MASIDLEPPYSLLSAENSSFDFSTDEDGSYASIDLLRFAELDPRIVLAHKDSTNSSPLDLSITITVTKVLESTEDETVEEDTPVSEIESESGIDAVLVPLFATFTAIFIVALVLTILHYKKILNLNRLKKKIPKIRCCKKCTCRKKKKTPFQI